MKVLLVDDEKLNRMVIGHILNQAGYDFESCESGEQALAYLQHHSCDVILMDRQMPGLDGPATARKIRRMEIPQPIIISFSAYSDQHQEEAAREAGMDATIAKPISAEQLTRLIADLQGS